MSRVRRGRAGGSAAVAAVIAAAGYGWWLLLRLVLSVVVWLGVRGRLLRCVGRWLEASASRGMVAGRYRLDAAGYLCRRLPRARRDGRRRRRARGAVCER